MSSGDPTDRDGDARKRRRNEGDAAMVLVRTTVAHEADARRIAQSVVEKGLASCVHIQAVTSTYRWQGRVEVEPEWLVEARVVPEKSQALRAAVLANHPYKVPLLETVRCDVSAQYAAWAASENPQ